MAAIYLDQLLPVGSAFRQATYLLLIPGPSTSLLGLAGGGVYPAGAVTAAAVRSCRTISPLPVPRKIEAIGCVFSVALSRGSPRVAVNHHRALSCSDFPPRTYFEIPMKIHDTTIFGSIKLCLPNQRRYLEIGAGRPPDPLF